VRWTLMWMHTTKLTHINEHPDGKDLPVLLQQSPRSLAQGSATVVRGLLDPELEGKMGTPTHVITRRFGVYVY
jgi:hypothetical protein